METDESGTAGRLPISDYTTPAETAEESASSAEQIVLGPESNRGKHQDWLDERLQAILESLLLAAGEPVTLSQLANAVEEVPRERIRKALSELAASYATGGRGFALEEIAGGYQLRTPSEHAVYVRRLLSAKPPRLSRPVLETLAIVAYRQPITRPEIEQLRGVDSGGVLDTLAERNLIKIAGRKEAPGRPILYETTPDFLELFGLKDLGSLPELEEFRDLAGSRETAETAPDPISAEAANDSASRDDPDASQTITSEQSIDPLLAQTDNDGQPPPGASTVQREDEGAPPCGKDGTNAENDDERERGRHSGPDSGRNQITQHSGNRPRT